MTHHVEIREVVKTYGDFTVLDQAALSIAPGEFVAIVGPSGCGKSTLLEIVGGLREADAGEVRIGGEPIRGPQETTGIIFQDASTLPWRTLKQNVALPMELRGVSKSERFETADRMIAAVGLDGFQGHYPSQLSGGMRQRVALARVLTTSPELILADEPFGALDEQTRLMVALELLAVVRQTSASVLFITHSIQEAVLLSDRVLVMSARPGRIIDEVAVEIDGERTSELIGTEHVDVCSERVWASLRAESQKAMSQRVHV